MLSQTDNPTYFPSFTCDKHGPVVGFTAVEYSEPGRETRSFGPFCPLCIGEWYEKTFPRLKRSGPTSGGDGVAVSDPDLYLRYLGVLGILTECSVYVPEEVRETIEHAMDDATKHHPLRVHRVLNRIEIEPISRETEL